MSSTYIPVRDDELDIGLAYAEAKYNVTLCREALQILCNKTLELRQQIGGRYGFPQAKRQVLYKELSQRSFEERRRFTAYGGAIGKIGNRRAQLARRQRQATAHRHAPVQKREYPEKKHLFLRGNQYAFV